jgi:hypothetical protein
MPRRAVGAGAGAGQFALDRVEGDVDLLLGVHLADAQVLRRGGQEAVIAIAHNGVGCSIVVSNTLPQA